jgi:phosphoserine phosphatase
MTQIVLIRPGTTQFDLEHRIQGTLDIPLAKPGTEDVEQLVSALRGRPITTVYHAPCQAAQQTAAALAAALDAKLKVAESLHNVDLGLWQGRCIDEVKRTQPRVYRQWQEHPETVCPPQGETLASARMRIEPALTRLLKKHRDEMIALVVPEPLTTLVRSCLMQTELGDLWKACDRHGECEIVDARELPLVESN